MQCVKCRKDIPDNSAFCNLCGAVQTRKKAKGNRQKNGAGTYKKRKNGLIEFKVSIGIRGDGAPNRKSFYGRTEKECRAKYKEWLENSDNVPIERVETVGQWADKWLELYKKNHAKYGTYRNYVGYVNNRIKPKLGALKLEQVRPAHIEQFYATISTLSASAQKHIYLALDGIFKTAVSNHFCAENPVSKLIIATQEVNMVEVFATLEIQAIIQSRHQYAYIPQLMLYTGLRQGEVLALKWADIDIDNRIITISASLARQEGGGYVEKSTKSGKARTVPLNEKIIEFLTSLPKSGLFVAMNEKKNKQLTPKAFDQRYRAFFDDTGIRYLSSHKCRHTYATYLVKGGADLSAVQAMLGHSTVKVTEKYTHVDNDAGYLKDNVTKLSYS